MPNIHEARRDLDIIQASLNDGYITAHDAATLAVHIINKWDDETRDELTSWWATWFIRQDNVGC
jgi:hypothetical protein